MRTLWLIVAAVCGVCALYYGYKGNYDNAFLAAALGACAAFLNYRTYLRQNLKNDEEDS